MNAHCVTVPVPQMLVILSYCPVFIHPRHSLSASVILGSVPLCYAYGDCHFGVLTNIILHVVISISLNIFKVKHYYSSLLHTKEMQIIGVNLISLSKRNIADLKLSDY